MIPLIDLTEDDTAWDLPLWHVTATVATVVYDLLTPPRKPTPLVGIPS